MIDEMKIENFFLRTIASLNEILDNEEHSYVYDEIGLDKENIRIVKDCCCIMYPESSNYTILTIKATLNILNVETNEKVGYYSLIEDINGEFVDEFLV